MNDERPIKLNVKNITKGTILFIDHGFNAEEQLWDFDLARVDRVVLDYSDSREEDHYVIYCDSMYIAEDNDFYKINSSDNFCCIDWTPTDPCIRLATPKEVKLFYDFAKKELNPEKIEAAKHETMKAMGFSEDEMRINETITPLGPVVRLSSDANSVTVTGSVTQASTLTGDEEKTPPPQKLMVTADKYLFLVNKQGVLAHNIDEAILIYRKMINERNENLGFDASLDLMIRDVHQVEPEEFGADIATIWSPEYI